MVGDRAFADTRAQFDEWVLAQDWDALAEFHAARAAGDAPLAAFAFRGYIHGTAARLGLRLPSTALGAGPGDLAAALADLADHAAAFASFAEGYVHGFRGDGSR